LPQQVGQGDSKGVRQSIQKVERRVLGLSFNAAQVSAINASVSRELLLREPLADANPTQIPSQKLPRFHPRKEALRWP
jgi:hypothetical protein